ncbi:hypothetical protein, partial [Rhizobium sp.]|uniref:hypothetical protein n=1 Tax=Rhizobium sp. TaxID=391 RepID=UPI002AA727BB
GDVWGPFSFSGKAINPEYLVYIDQADIAASMTSPGSVRDLMPTCAAKPRLIQNPIGTRSRR